MGSKIKNIFGGMYMSDAKLEFTFKSSFDKYYKDAELTEYEEEAIEIIKSVFEKENVSFDRISFRRRSVSYLSFIIDNENYKDFCRIKVGSRSVWVSLDMWNEKREELEKDVRFSNVTNKNQRHWKVNLNNIDDFESISELILAVYQAIVSPSDSKFTPKTDIKDLYVTNNSQNYRTSNYTDTDTFKNNRNKGSRLRKFVKDYVLFDLETTSKYPTNAKITEIAAIKVHNDEIVDSFDTLVNPEVSIPPEVVKLTGITDEMVKNAPVISDVFPQFIDFIGNEILVGHNINTYDLNIIYDLGLDLLGMNVANDFVDTCDLARCLEELDVPNYKLSTLCDFWGVTNDNAHRAYSDVLANNECYKKMRNYSIGEYKFSVRQFESCNLKPCIDIAGKSICLTGEFDIGSRKEMENMLLKMGADVKKNPVKSLNYLLIGNQGSDFYRSGTKGGKIEKAEEFNAKGANIQIMKESEFFKENEVLENV